MHFRSSRGKGSGTCGQMTEIKWGRGYVQQGLVARDISWLTAAKIAIFVAILSGFARGAQGRAAKRE